jgi:hypothetical protein
VGRATHASPLIILLDPFFLRHKFACLTALQTVVAAIIHQPHIVFAIAKIAVPVALASFFHLLADNTPESLGHGRTLPRIPSARNCQASATGSGVCRRVTRHASAAGSAIRALGAPATLPARFAAC